MNTKIAFATAAFAALVASQAALAGTTVTVSNRVNAAGPCQGALPAFAGTLRARPLALRNEGSSPVFVSCSVGSHNDNRHANISLYFSATTEVTVDCTVVTGRILSGGSNATYYTGTAIVSPAGGGSMLVTFPETDAASAFVNANCTLPPGAELNYIRHDRLDPAPAA